MCAGTFPFGDPDEANGKNGVQTMIARIMKVDITPLPDALSAELKDLLKCILVADPSKRPSIQQVMPVWMQGSANAKLEKDSHMLGVGSRPGKQVQLPCLQLTPSIHACLCRAENRLATN